MGLFVRFFIGFVVCFRKSVGLWSLRPPTFMIFYQIDLVLHYLWCHRYRYHSVYTGLHHVKVIPSSLFCWWWNQGQINIHFYYTIQVLTSVRAGTYSENKTNKQNISTIFYRLSQNNDIQDNAISTLTSDPFQKLTNPNIFPQNLSQKMLQGARHMDFHGTINRLPVGFPGLFRLLEPSVPKSSQQHRVTKRGVVMELLA